MDKIKLGYDEDYEPSDSEDDLDEEEKELINKVRRKREVDDPKKEVLRFDDSESDDDEDDDDGLAASDIEDGGEFDGIPDEKAWGKKRSAYYHTDFVDQDYSAYNEKEQELAEQEEEEAKAIQQRLAQQLDEADFTLDIYSETLPIQTEIDETSTKTKLKTDFTQLSARQKEQLFQKDSPEFAGLVQDFEKYMLENQTVLSPVLKFVKDNKLKLPVFDFVQTRSNLILTYCTNISFYLVLKSKRVTVKNHPVVKRLVQLRQLITQLDQMYEELVKPQLDEMLEAINSGEEVIIEPLSVKKNVKNGKKKQLGILEKKTRKPSIKSKEMAVNDESNDSEDEENPNELLDTSDEEMKKAEEQDVEMNGKENGDEDDERRGINYQIAKNKGLTPSRKKENRNPRVKHRNKFRKAMVRRKGAVRTVRKETTRYGGEISGIKSNVRKSIKFKS